MTAGEGSAVVSGGSAAWPKAAAAATDVADHRRCEGLMVPLSATAVKARDKSESYRSSAFQSLQNLPLAIGTMESALTHGQRGRRGAPQSQRSTSLEESSSVCVTADADGLVGNVSDCS